MVTPIDQGHSLPQSLSLAVGCVRWIPPQQDHTTWSPTRQPCGPGDRPYPPRPRSHLVTHIVRFVTHLARKSISELLHRKDSFSLYDCSNTRIKIEGKVHYIFQTFRDLGKLRAKKLFGQKEFNDRRDPPLYVSIFSTLPNLNTEV